MFDANGSCLSFHKDKVLFVCLYVLLNLASDANVEKKVSGWMMNA